MIDFMKAHPALAFNKFMAPDGAKHKQRLLNELTVKLNCCSTGATKMSDKWLKSWQDWRSDTKSKAAKIRRSQNGTGGDPPCKLVLSPIEEELLAIMGPVAVEGLNVLDPIVAANQVALQNQDQVVEDQVQDAIVGDQVGPDFILPVQGTHLSVQIPSISPPLSAASIAGESCCSSSSHLSSSSPVPKRRRTLTSSTEAEVEERIVNCTEATLHVQRDQLKLQEQQVKLQTEEIQLLREQLQLQREQGERMQATYNRVADAVIGGIHSLQQYLSHLKGT